MLIFLLDDVKDPQKAKTLAVSNVWVALNEYREELIPSNCDDETNPSRDQIWDELCASMNLIEKLIDGGDQQ